VARACSICLDGNRSAIDHALVAGEPATRIAAKYRVSADAVARHAAHHLPKLLARARDAADQVRGDDLLAQLRELQQRTLRLLDRAERAERLTPALLAVGQARQNIELLAKLLGELDERPHVNVLVSPQWVTLRTVLLAALGPYAEARAAVAERLVALEADDGLGG
jgi:hypothetical protein